MKEPWTQSYTWLEPNAGLQPQEIPSLSLVPVNCLAAESFLSSVFTQLQFLCHFSFCKAECNLMNGFEERLAETLLIAPPTAGLPTSEDMSSDAVQLRRAEFSKVPHTQHSVFFVYTAWLDLVRLKLGGASLWITWFLHRVTWLSD